MPVIYATREWNGYGKQNYYHNEYRLEGGRVVQYKCHRQRVFNGDENEWIESESETDSWDIDDPDMPEWLHEHL